MRSVGRSYCDYVLVMSNYIKNYYITKNMINYKIRYICDDEIKWASYNCDDALLTDILKKKIKYN
jgi:hypothetical protein